MEPFVIPQRTAGENPERLGGTSSLQTAHPVVGSVFFAMRSPGMTKVVPTESRPAIDRTVYEPPASFR